VQPSDRMADKLLETLLNYLTARRAFDLAVDEARRQGWTDERIQRMTGLSRITAEPVLGRRTAQPVPASTQTGRPAAA
jgi:hypothetical protein